MRVFVAGATGAIGAQLLPMLVRAGHAVTAMTHSPSKAEGLRSAGAVPVIADALDASSVLGAMEQARPEIVIHQLTAIPARLDIRAMAKAFEPTNRLRTQGTDHLLSAARAVGARRFIAQSFGGWPYAHTGSAIKTEEDPLDDRPAPQLREILKAIRYLETAVSGSREPEGVVLRYGFFYGPNTSISRTGSTAQEIRRRRVPIVGRGNGIWSFIHIYDAAAATAAAVSDGAPGVYNIVDDEPAPVKEWLPHLASCLGAPRPYHIPTFLARLAIGAHGVAMMTTARGASNAKVKQAMAWRPLYPSWRLGFREGL